MLNWDRSVVLIIKQPDRSRVANFFIFNQTMTHELELQAQNDDNYCQSRAILEKP